MPLQTGERAFHRVQIGAETVEGTPVAAAFLLPAESASEPDLNRAPNTPSEDYGELANAHPGRSQFGVREASMTLRGQVRFEDFMTMLEWAVAGGVTPTPVDALYLWEYALDNDADTLISKTIETGDNISFYQVPGALCSRLRMSYTALKPGSASPWEFEATVVGYDKHSINGFTSPTAQDKPETAMGHLTRMFYGAVATAFDALPQLAHSLVALDITIDTGVLLRKQGGTDDKPDGHGRGKVAVTYTALLESISSTKAAVWDVFENDAANPAIPDRRVRFQVLGSPLGGTNDVQTVTITGTPAGGHFTITFNGFTTGNIAYNASAADVATALMALSSVGYGNVVCTGGALPGSGVTVTFVNQLGYGVQPVMTTSDALTGGTTPASHVAHTTPGVSSAAKSIIIDGQTEITAIPTQESDGATRYAVAGMFVKDADLASIGKISILNSVATLPD